jgi:F-type H+-transporting ATPase subunit a
MSITRRGFIIFGGLVIFSAIFCYWLPFQQLPAMGLGAGLPVISLPAEVLRGNIGGSVVPGFDLTNTMTSMLLIDIIVLLIALVVRRAVTAQPADRFVPRGLTNLIEMIVEFWYNTARNNVGKYAGRVMPLALTIFIFLLVTNLIKLIPGVETVGIISCAEAGQSGYDLQARDASGAPIGPFLNVNQPTLKLRAGVKATAADTHACEAKYPQFTPPITPAKEERPKASGGETEKKNEGEQKAPATKESGAVLTDTPVRLQDAASGTGKSTAAETGNPNIFVVIPYFRALTTDLNLTLGLAIIVFLSVQIWGVWALGPAYFFKFVNVPTLGNLGKKPMGAMDFVVGLIEIVSELSRLVSLSFRLLGSMFAGGVLLAVMTFLVAGGLPIVFYGLEIFFGVIQAYVFAILTVMYASLAVTAHHGDEEHEEHAAEAEHATH